MATTVKQDGCTIKMEINLLLNTNIAGKTWESLIDNNTWEPGVVGTETLWSEVVS